MELSVRKKLDNETIDNIFVTALEGGSNYWYQLEDATVIAIKQATPEMNGHPLATRFRPALENGIVIPIVDLEDEDNVLGELSAKTLQDRTDKLIADDRNELDNVLDESYDAFDADVIFQYWVMGEIVFG